MGTRTTVVLLLSVLLLGGFIWFVERKADSTAKRIEDTRRALRFDPATIREITLRIGDLEVAAARRPGGWQLTSPVAARADEGGVERILETLRDLSRSEIVTAGQREERDLGLAEYGLDQPRAVIRLRSDKGERGILIGRPAAVGGQLYIMEEGSDDIIVTSTNLLAVLPADATTLRDRRVFTGLPGDVVRIDLRRADGFLQVVRGKEYGWRIQKPVEARAAPVPVQSLIDRFFDLTIEEFVAETTAGAALYGLDEPAAQVSLIAARGPGEQTLRIGKPVETATNLVYAGVVGIDAVFAISADVLEPMSVSVDDLRDRRLLPLLAGDIVRIEIREGERVVALLRSVEGEWNVVQPRQVKADASRVNLLLSEWTGARIETFLEDAPPVPTGAVSRSVSFAVASGASATGGVSAADGSPFAVAAPPIMFAIQDVEGRDDVVRVSVVGETNAFLIARDPVFALSADPLAFRDREVLALDADTIRGIAVQAGNSTWEISREGTNGFVAVGGTAAIDAESLGALLEELDSVRALDFVPDMADPNDVRGLATPKAQVTIGLQGDSGISKTILFGVDSGEEGVYAAIRGQDTVFILPKSVRDNLLRPLYNLPPAHVAPPDVGGSGTTPATP